MLRLREVSKTFGKGKNEFTALKGVTLDFPTKGLVIILGKSGSGKSTLLNIIGGLDKASSGEIIIDGKSTKEFSPKDYDSYRNTYVGMVFQEFNLIDEITLAENIAISLRLQTDSAELSRIDDALAAVGLANMGYRKPTELSGGQRQRVAIARALIKNPEIILADEPTGALDFATGEYIFDTLKKIARDKLVVVVTHDRELAYSYGDRIVEIVDGEIVSDNSRLNKSGRVTALGDNVLEVECGAELALDDINGKLKKGANYVGIYQNRDKLAAAYPQMLNDGGEKRETVSAKELFTPTEEVEADDTEFSLKEGKLKFKDAFFMAVSNIKRTKRKFTFLVAFTAVAFVFMVISFILSTLSSAQLVSATVFDNSDRGQVCVSKLIETDDGKSLIALDDNDIKVVSGAADSTVLKHYTNKLSPVFAHKQTSIDRNTSGSDGTYGLDYFTGIITGSPRNLGLRVTGSDKCTNTDEIIISDLAAFELIRSGFVGNSADGAYGIPEVNNIEQLIGSRVKIYQTDITYKIVGVFHTDYEKYSGITSASSLDSSAERDKAEFIQNSNFIYSKVFAHNEFPNVFASMSGGDSTVSFEVSFEDNSSSGARALSQLMYSEDAVNSHVTTSGASAFLWNKDNVMSLEDLRENQIVLSLFDTAKILNRLDDYYEGDSRAIFQDASFTRLANSSLTVTFYDGSGGIFKRMDGVRLVGVLDPKFNNPDEAGDRLLLAEGDVRKLYSSNTAVNSVYFDSDTSESGLTRKINRLADKGYLVTTAAAPAQSVVAIDDAVSMLSQISLYITIAFAVFALLFMFNYVSQSIKFRTKEIAVYRIIGARGKDLSKMFLIEGLFIAVITTVIASILSALVAVLLNELIAGIMLSSFNITFGLISFKFWHVPLIFVVCLAFVGVSLLFPILNIVRKKPVDALKMI